MNWNPIEEILVNRGIWKIPSSNFQAKWNFFKAGDQLCGECVHDFGSCMLFKKYELPTKKNLISLHPKTGKEDKQPSNYLLVPGPICAIAASCLLTLFGLSKSKVKRKFVKKLLLTIMEVVMLMDTNSSKADI